MDHRALKAFLDANAEAMSGMTAAQKADWCNARVEREAVRSDDVIRYLFLQGKWMTVKLSSDAAALTLVEGLDRFPTFDLDNPAYLAAISSALDGAVTAGFITDDDKTAILALGDDKRTRAEKAGFGTVHLRHIQRAEALI